MVLLKLSSWEKFANKIKMYINLYDAYFMHCYIIFIVNVSDSRKCDNKMCSFENAKYIYQELF